MWLIEKLKNLKKKSPLLEFNLYRYYTRKGDGATIGAFTSPNYPDFMLYSIERPLLYNGQKNNQDNPNTKINESCCIPAGTYKCKLTFSNRFQKNLYLVLNTGIREGVRLHSGNTINDIEGCILLGLKIQKNIFGYEYFLADSQKAFKKFYEITKNQQIIIKIIDDNQEQNLKLINFS